MKTEELNYHLPAQLIAQRPAGRRSCSRLLVLDRATGSIIDSRFDRIGDFLVPGDCLVLNDTMVLPARFFARRKTGGALEALFLSERRPGLWEILLKGARKVNVGEVIRVETRNKTFGCLLEARIVEKVEGGSILIEFDSASGAEHILKRVGFAPLPPYIKRNRDPRIDAVDRARYQTVYARRGGAVAAPTAGLHFTRRLLERLEARGVSKAFVTLHTGRGTFRPITAESINNHQVDAETFSIDAENSRLINDTRKKGRRIIAVGTTSVRTLETAASGTAVRACGGRTRLFIKPSYKFKVVDCLVTNFHLPKSSLLALVAAFAGLENIMAAYRHAVRTKYRFYSYGDAMLVI